MARSRSLIIAAALLSFTVSAAPVFAQGSPSNSTWSQDDTVRIIKDVQKKISSLTDYAVFDWITFGIHGKTIVLNGYASRPTLKDEAGRVVKGIPGIASVDNQIEVLPNSPNDDRVRAAVYNRIYTRSDAQPIQRQRGASWPWPQRSPHGRRHHRRPAARVPRDPYHCEERQRHAVWHRRQSE